MATRKLMIGGGEITAQYKQLGWTVLDGDPNSNPDIVAVLPPLPDFDSEWDLIQAVHVIEHFFYEDARILLQSIWKALKPGGALVLEQPNLEWVAKAILGEVSVPIQKYAWMQGETKWFTEWVLYPQPHMINGNPLQMHRYMYTPQSLSKLVEECGFVNVRTLASVSHVPERDFRLEAFKQGT